MDRPEALFYQVRQELLGEADPRVSSEREFLPAESETIDQANGRLVISREYREGKFSFSATYYPRNHHFKFFELNQGTFAGMGEEELRKIFSFYWETVAKIRESPDDCCCWIRSTHGDLELDSSSNNWLEDFIRRRHGTSIAEYAQANGLTIRSTTDEYGSERPWLISEDEMSIVTWGNDGSERNDLMVLNRQIDLSFRWLNLEVSEFQKAATFCLSVLNHFNSSGRCEQL